MTHEHITRLEASDAREFCEDYINDNGKVKSAVIRPEGSDLVYVLFAGTSRPDCVATLTMNSIRRCYDDAALDGVSKMSQNKRSGAVKAGEDADKLFDLFCEQFAGLPDGEWHPAITRQKQTKAEIQADAVALERRRSLQQMIETGMTDAAILLLGYTKSDIKSARKAGLNKD